MSKIRQFMGRKTPSLLTTFKEVQRQEREACEEAEEAKEKLRKARARLRQASQSIPPPTPELAPGGKA